VTFDRYRGTQNDYRLGAHRVTKQKISLEIIVHLTDKDDDLESELSGMANATMKMVTDSVDAYVKRDPELARGCHGRRRCRR